MKRSVFIATLAVWGLAAPSLHAQPSDKVRRIGWLIAATAPTATGRSSPGFCMRPCVIWAGSWQPRHRRALWGPHPQRQREIAAELKALPVALIVAGGTTAIRAARDGTPGVPIVMVNAGDPVGSGLVASLARPGGDLTGTSAAGEEILTKQVELLAAALPQLSRVSLLMNSSNPANGFYST